MADMNWVSAPFTKLIEQYRELDTRMQRLVRWLVRILAAILLGVFIYLCSISYKNFQKPETITEYKTKIEYRDTCIQETNIFDSKESNGVKSINQKGGQTAKDITNTYN